MPSVMYESEGVLSAVRRLLDAAYAGRGGMEFVVAPAGLGKSSVLDTVVNEAGAQFDVRIGRADAVEATLPYGLIGQAIGEDVPLDDDSGGDLPAANRHYATLRRVRRLAADRPVLLAFDDLHWSDPDSLTLVHLLARRVRALPVAVVATARPSPDTALQVADQLAVYGLAGIQWLRPLTTQAARAVLRDRLGELAEEAVARVVAASDGNPLLLELSGLDLHSPAAPDPSGGPPNRRLLLARFSAADTSAQRYLQAASVLGVRFRPAIAAAIASNRRGPRPALPRTSCGPTCSATIRKVASGSAMSCCGKRSTTTCPRQRGRTCTSKPSESSPAPTSPPARRPSMPLRPT